MRPNRMSGTGLPSSNIRSDGSSGAARVKTTSAVIAAQIRRALKEGGSAEHAQSVQRSFQEEIKSPGWYTADLRRPAARFRRQIQKDHGLDFPVAVADQLLLGSVREEKIAAIFPLEKLDAQFGGSEYKLFESWLGRISSWADHDALVHYCIAPTVARKPVRLKTVFRWAKSADRWHRRAPCVALIRGAREKVFFREIIKLADLLLADEDDRVQKGLGWLLRETAKYDAKQTVAYLMKIRRRAPRLVLRTACETLPATARKQRAVLQAIFRENQALRLQALIRSIPSHCLQ